MQRLVWRNDIFMSHRLGTESMIKYSVWENAHKLCLCDNVITETFARSFFFNFKNICEYNTVFGSKLLLIACEISLLVALLRQVGADVLCINLSQKRESNTDWILAGDRFNHTYAHTHRHAHRYAHTYTDAWLQKINIISNDTYNILNIKARKEKKN